jgi:transcriptional regulator with XRE-family HTH domain
MQNPSGVEIETDDREQEVSGRRGRPTDKILTPMGDYILDKLAELHQTRQWLATAAALDPTTITRIMYGVSSPKAEQLTRIAAALGVGYVELVESADATRAGEPSGRVRYIAMQMQELVDGLPEEQAAEVLDQLESLLRLLWRLRE